MFRTLRWWWPRSPRPGGPRPASHRFGPLVEALESREVPSTILDLLRGTNALVRFDSANPGVIQATIPVTGLVAGDTLRSIDFRPSTGTLYGLGINAADTQARLYIINPVSGIATALPNVAAGLTAGNFWGMSFDPVADQVRIVNDSDENARLNPNDGSLAVNDTNLNPPLTSIVDSLAYDNPFAGAASTTLFGVNLSGNALARVGGPGGVPSPNGGVVTDIGPLGVMVNLNGTGLDFSSQGTLFAGMKPNGGVNSLFTVSPATGAATLVGQIGDGLGVSDGLAVISETPGW